MAQLYAGRALITGVSGFVGGALVSRLLRGGWSVRGSTRDPTRVALPSEVELVQTATLGPDTSWDRALEDVTTVFHLASRVHRRNEHGAAARAAYHLENTLGTTALARAAARAGVRRFVFVSSIKVNGGERSAPYTEMDEPAPVDAYGVSKRSAEEGLRQVSRETGMAAYVVRPPLVYGPGVRANFLSLFRLADRGWPLPFGAVDNRRSLVAVDNLTDLLLRCATTPAPGGTFLVSDGDDVSTPELIRRIASALGKPARLLRFPPAMLRVGLDSMGLRGAADRLLGNLYVDSSGTRTRLGWNPPVTMAQQLESIATWYRTTGGR
jgi:UDP-glucose 4-epimerase